MSKVWLVSYPRSGNTWMRFLMANILYPDKDINYRSINRLVPDIHQQQNWAKEGVENPQFIKSHFKFKDDYRRVIYLYRDGRDAAISLYYFYMLDEKGLSFDQFFCQQFISGQLLFGDWKKHITFWMFEDHKIEFLPIRYEELYSDTRWELAKMAKFSDIKATIAEIETAVDKSSFEELEKIRARDGVHPKMKGLRGKPGGWRETFTKSQNGMFWDYAGDLMEKLGYKKE